METLRNRQLEKQNLKEQNHRWTISHLTEFYGRQRLGNDRLDAAHRTQFPDYMTDSEKSALVKFYNIFETNKSTADGRLIGTWAYPPTPPP